MAHQAFRNSTLCRLRGDCEECLLSCNLPHIFRCADEKILGIFVRPDMQYVSDKLDDDALYFQFCRRCAFLHVEAFMNFREFLSTQII
jgi:hypothetical protein